MIVSACKGIPIEILFTPGSENDTRAFKRFLLIFQRNLLFTEIELITATNLRTFLVSSESYAKENRNCI